MGQRGREIEVLLSLMEEQRDQLISEGEEYRDKRDKGHQSDDALGPEGIAHALLVAVSEVLGGEDPRPGQAAENA